jgi:hypothetical protein
MAALQTAAHTSNAELSTVTSPCPAAESPRPSRSIASEAAVPAAGPARPICKTERGGWVRGGKINRHVQNLT